METWDFGKREDFEKCDFDNREDFDNCDDDSSGTIEVLRESEDSEDRIDAFSLFALLIIDLITPPDLELAYDGVSSIIQFLVHIFRKARRKHFFIIFSFSITERVKYAPVLIVLFSAIQLANFLINSNGFGARTRIFNPGGLYVSFKY